MSKINSPCKKICKIDKEDNLCIGCYRNAQEIFNWIYFSDDEKMKILLESNKRKERENLISNLNHSDLDLILK